MNTCKSILIIDDDADIRETLKEALEFEGYTASTATNGLNALDYLKKAPELPGLIILDLMMPVMDGSMFLEVIHRDHKDTFARIPLILATAKGCSANTPNSHLAFDRIRKPLDLDDLYAAIRKHCGEVTPQAS